MGEQVSFGTFSNYRQTVAELRDAFTNLKGFCVSLGMKNASESIDEMMKKSAEDSFDVAIVGEFRRGKSTLINALLGKAILPSDVLPTTATLNRVTYGITPFVKIEYKNGTTEDIDINQLSDYVTKLTDESEQRAQTIRQATVYYPVNYCKNNVDIIDTPGLNDDENMTEVTLSVLPQTDAALFVIMAQSPFSEYERDFLENKMLVSDIGRIIFVVTRIDSFDEEDADRVIQNISDRIKKYVMEKAKKVLGEDSEEFSAYKRKLGSIKVLGVSAKQALKAKKTDDRELWEQSRFGAFEAELERLLTEERGAISLQVQVSKILSVSAEIVKNVELRTGALQMSEEEFNQKYAEAKEKIAQIRERRKTEFDRIDISAQNAYGDIRPQAEGFWQELTDNACRIIDDETITEADIQKDRIAATQEAILEKIKKSTEDYGQLLTEKLQNSITTALGNETERLQDFQEDFYQSISQVQCEFGGLSERGSSTVGEIVVGTFAESFLMMGLGGAYQGFKQAGWKGALVGGAVGLGASYGGVLLLSSLAIPFSWPVVLAVGLAGTLASRFAIGRLFNNAEKQILKFREKLKEAVCAKFEEMASENNMTKQVEKQISTAFNALKQRIDEETEAILQDTENTLVDLQEKVTENKVLAEKEQEDLKQMVEKVAHITETAAGLNEQILAVLSK